MYQNDQHNNLYSMALKSTYLKTILRKLYSKIYLYSKSQKIIVNCNNSNVDSNID